MAAHTRWAGTSSLGDEREYELVGDELTVDCRNVASMQWVNGPECGPARLVKPDGGPVFAVGCIIEGGSQPLRVVRIISYDLAESRLQIKMETCKL